MITDKEKRDLALKKIEQFEYGYSSKLEKNIMITLFVDGFNEATRQINDLSLGDVSGCLNILNSIFKSNSKIILESDDIGKMMELMAENTSIFEVVELVKNSR